MKIKLLTLLSIVPLLSFSGEKIKVAVIDTGIRPGTPHTPCKSGHLDLTGSGIYDYMGHGSHITSLIDKTVKSHNNDTSKYCQVIIKYTNGSPNEKNTIKLSTESILHAIKEGVVVINYSGGGYGYSKEEHEAVKLALDMGIFFVAAAGNDKMDLSVNPFYPASYDKRVIVVGNSVNNSGNILLPHYMSNFGKIIDVWEVGTNIISKIGNSDVIMTGTSQSAAIHSGKIISKLLKK